MTETTKQQPFRVKSASFHYFIEGPGGRQFGDPFTWPEHAQDLAENLNEAFRLGVEHEQRKVNAEDIPKPCIGAACDGTCDELSCDGDK